MTTASTDGVSIRMLEDNQRRTALYLAGLLDGEVERRSPVERRTWVAEHLGCHPSELTELRRVIRGFDRIVQLSGLGQLLQDRPPLAVGGAELPGPPVFAPPLRPDLPELPEEVTAVWQHLEPLGCAVGLAVEPDYREDLEVHWFVPTKDLDTFNRALPGALRTLEGVTAAKLRGGCFLVVQQPAPAVEVLELPPLRREQLVLPASVWQLLDEDLHPLFRHAELLLELGLGADRGVLLHGPPGTGKTDLLRVITTELAGRATVLLPDVEVAREHLGDLYRLAARLRPSLVVLDDVDLVVGAERSGGALLEFLHAVDGAASLHEGIITLAATNRLHSLDDAATRPARFDRVIELPLPPRTGRERILRRYLGHFAEQVDIAQVADVTEGASGAHLREVVRQAILTTDAAPTTDALLTAVRELGLGSPGGRGVYL